MAARDSRGQYASREQCFTMTATTERGAGQALVAVIDENPILAEAMCRHVGSSKYFSRCDIVSLTWAMAEDLERIRPAIIVLDPVEPPNGLDVLVAELRASMPNLRLVAYSSEPTLQMARACMKYGFRAFLPKSADGAQVTAALTAVANGGMYVDRQFAECLQPMFETPDGASVDQLSAREEAILRQLARGASHKQIARDLGLSHKTVDTYRARGMQKLALADRSALIRFALERNWLD